MKNLMKTIVVLIALSFASFAEARITRTWSYQEIHAQADLVIIARPLSTKDTLERTVLPGISPEVRVIGVETEFDVQLVMKGEAETTRVVLHHYRFVKSDDAFARRAPNLASFTDDRQNYLLFLKKEDGRRYTPATGLVDPVGFSVMSLESKVGAEQLKAVIGAALPAVPALTAQTATGTRVGRVVDQAGNLIENVRWRIGAVEDWRDGRWALTHYSGVPREYFTDGEGRFELPFHGRQRFDLQFDRSGFGPVFLYRVAQEASELRVVMKAGILVRGTVVCSDENLFRERVLVELRLPGRDFWFQQKTLTDADGHFEFYASTPPLEPGRAAPSRWQIVCAGKVVLIDVTDAEPVDVQIELSVKAQEQRAAKPERD